jgi:hypothetical protein
LACRFGSSQTIFTLIVFRFAVLAAIPEAQMIFAGSIDYQIDPDIHHRHGEHEALEGREVGRGQRLDRERADARPGEHFYAFQRPNRTWRAGPAPVRAAVLWSDAVLTGHEGACG